MIAVSLRRHAAHEQRSSDAGAVLQERQRKEIELRAERTTQFENKKESESSKYSAKAEHLYAPTHLLTRFTWSCGAVFAHNTLALPSSFHKTHGKSDHRHQTRLMHAREAAAAMSGGKQRIAISSLRAVIT